MHAESWGYDNHLDPKIINDSDYSEVEDFHLTGLISKYLSKKCARFGFLDDEVGYELYISEDGYIYASHHDSPTLLSKSFEVFLNNELTGNRTILELPDRTNGKHKN